MVYNLIPKSLAWSIKVIGKTGSGKTTFVSAFLGFLIRYIVGIENIYLLSPTSNEIGWDRIKNNIKHINHINEIVDGDNSIIVCDDMQIQLKGNKTLTEMIWTKRILLMKMSGVDTFLIKSCINVYFIFFIFLTVI